MTKRKKRKIINIILKIISFIMLILACANTYLIIKYDVLPLKFLILFLVIIVLIPLLFTFLSIKIGKKKLGIKIFILFLDLIYTAVLLCALYYLSVTFTFFEGFNKGYEVTKYYVVSMNGSGINDISDLNSKIIGYVNDDEDFKKPLDMLNKRIKPEYKQYIGTVELFDGLSMQEVSAIVLLDNQYDMYFEDMGVENNTKIVYEFSIEEKTSINTKEVKVDKEPFTIYVSGMDSYGKISAKSRSDVNILLSVNPKTHQILLINTPRDYYVTLPSKGSKDKLTHAGLYGVDESVKALENLLDIEINYYIKVNYSALIKLIDAIDGVDVYSEHRFTSGEKYYRFKEGYNHVNGDQALEFVRTRYAFTEGDRARGQNQQRMIEAIVTKMTKNDILLKKYNSILNSLSGTFVTNISSDMITDLVRIQLKDMPSWNLVSISLNGSDGNEYTFSYPSQPLYVMVPDEETIESAKNIINLLYDGKVIEKKEQ